MSIFFLSVFSNVSVCSAHLIISFHPSSDLLTIPTSRDRPFSPLVTNQTVVHLWRWSILCNFPHLLYNHCSLRPRGPNSIAKTNGGHGRISPLDPPLASLVVLNQSVAFPVREIPSKVSLSLSCARMYMYCR